MRRAIIYINHRMVIEFEWFVRIDDDSFLVVENLLYFLSGRDASKREYYAAEFKAHGGYGATGSGLIFSYFNFRLLAAHLTAKACTLVDTHNDDLEISRCLHKVRTMY